MEIANPIYDVVFKFMLEDLETARLFLSGMLEVDILEISFSPQELMPSSTKPQRNPPKVAKRKKQEHDFSMRPMRLDFVAKIRSAEHGERLVIIELQKVRLLSDIMRFRRYLGLQYSNESNTYQSTNKKGNIVRNALPIYSVYFLGDRLDNIEGVPVLGIHRSYINLGNQEMLDQKDPFVESLTHDCRIVIIPDLPGHQSTELEQMLMIFDQTNATENGQTLELDKSGYPPKYEQLFRRLEKAAQSVEVRKVMDEEDDWLVEYRYWDMNTERANQKLEKAIIDRDEERRQKATAIKNLLSKGMSVEEVAQIFGIDTEEVRKQLD